MSFPSDRDQRPLNQLHVTVDGRRVEATLALPAASGGGPRQPRWMLRIDGGPPLRGPLTWAGTLEAAVESAAIAAFVRERRQVAAQYRAEHGEQLQQLAASGLIARIADALAVAPEDLLPRARRARITSSELDRTKR